MQQPKLGSVLCLVLAFSLLSCRKDQPPRVEVCIGDGFGGADCVRADGSRLYRSPSMLRNYWMTSQSDMSNFSSWCYDTNKAMVKQPMAHIYSRAKGLD